MMFDKSKREGLIKDYGESLLTNYARYHDATEKLKRFKPVSYTHLTLPTILLV